MNDNPRRMKALGSESAITAPSVGLAFLLSQAGAHAALSFAERLQGLGLEPPHAGILRLLGSNPDLSQQALSQTLGIFPSRLVALLDALETKRLLERRRSSSDRRIYHLRLTGAGLKALAAVGQVTVELEDSLFAALRPEEKACLGLVLTRIMAQQQVTPGVHPAYRQMGARQSASTAPGEAVMPHTFVTQIRKDPKKNVTGIVVPPEVVAALGTSKKPAVKVTLNGYTYRSTVATMGGHFMISLSAENRRSAGLEGDERVEVTLELDTETRTTEIPADLKAALVKSSALDAFLNMPPSRRKECVRQVEEAKATETRQRRILKIVESLQA